MVDYLPRSAWGARTSRGAVALSMSAVDGVALHWPGMAKPINAVGDIGKRRVASALRGWQAYHMDGRGWSDIAYQIAVDQAGRAWTLRGLNIRSGANGDGSVNRRYGAILLVLGPGEQPTDAMKTTVHGVVADFRKRFPGSRTKPYGHGEVRPDGTDCPGPAARSAISRGDFTPGANAPAKPPSAGEDWFDMATPEQIEKAVAAGAETALRNVLRDFYKDEAGTGDTIRDEGRAQNQVLVDAVKAAGSQIVAAIKATP